MFNNVIVKEDEADEEFHSEEENDKYIEKEPEKLKYR